MTEKERTNIIKDLAVAEKKILLQEAKIKSIGDQIQSAQERYERVIASLKTCKSLKSQIKASATPNLGNFRAILDLIKRNTSTLLRVRQELSRLRLNHETHRELLVDFTNEKEELESLLHSLDSTDLTIDNVIQFRKPND